MWWYFQATVLTDRVGDLQDRTNNTHQRAQDLLSFIHNMTMDLKGVKRDPSPSEMYQNVFMQHETRCSFSKSVLLRLILYESTFLTMCGLKNVIPMRK